MSKLLHEDLAVLGGLMEGKAVAPEQALAIMEKLPRRALDLLMLGYEGLKKAILTAGDNGLAADLVKKGLLVDKGDLYMTVQAVHTAVKKHWNGDWHYPFDRKRW